MTEPEPGPLVLYPKPPDVDDCGYINGSVNTTVSGEGKQYKYQTLNGMIPKDFINLTVGIYVVNVTDEDLIRKTDSANIN